MSERWTPKNGETYFYFNLNSFSDVYWKRWGMQTLIDHDLYQNGNCFRTRAEAEAAAEKVKALLLSLHGNNSLAMKVFEELDAFKKEICKPNLPKLTAEVFDRPDCPKWAKYAVVNMHGTGYFYEDEPSYGTENYKGMWYVDTGKVRMMEDAIFNAANWQNSLIERPSKAAFDKLLKNCAEQQANKILQKARERRLPEQYHNGPEKENTLPDWCKVGEWIWYPEDMAGGRYLKITEIRGGGVYAKEKEDYDPDYLCFDLVRKYSKQARLRPYNAEEMKALVGRTVDSDNGARYLVTKFYDTCGGEVCVNSIYYEADRLLAQFTINNKPAGVLEHLENGEWVE